MDARDTPEQAELRRSARQLARELAPATVADLDDTTRAKRLTGAVRDAGWLELRSSDGTGAALASGVDAGIVAEALGGAVADVSYLGPLLAGDVARVVGLDVGDGAVVAFSRSLTEPASVAGDATTAPVYAVDGAGGSIDAAFVLAPEDSGYRLALVRGSAAPAEVTGGSDLTRSVQAVPAGTPLDAVGGQRHVLTRDDLAAWTALGLALTSADLVGVMRGLLDVTVAYAAERRQFGVPVGSFQAVQHLLAEAHCLLEGSASVAAYASWAVDELAPSDARSAGRVAKAYCARAARTVCESAIQVHGGIGNTWDCLVHVYLRRSLLSSQWFGDDGQQLEELQRERLGDNDGLS
jgi:alkylation response protein AidB-like acyl-CoA dehydrogenase